MKVLYASAQTNCADKIGLSQACVKQCVDAPYTAGTDYSNLLTFCLDQDSEFNRAQQLETCCVMTDDCSNSMQDADECLKTELTNVKSAATEYLGCVYLEREAGVNCGFANFCIGILTGGAGTGEDNDFSVGADSSLAKITEDAQTCSDMDIFGLNACEAVAGCCAPCGDKIAAVANAVTNDILLPTYGNGSVTQCEDKTCAAFSGVTPITRQLDMTDASSIDISTISSEKMTEIVALADECNNGLSIDIASYNTTHAIENYLPCLYKKMGNIFADAESKKAAESSATAFSPGVTSAAVTAIVSTAFAALA